MALKKTLISGILYTGISKYTGILISLIITAILSRILSPNDFGIVAVATVIIIFFGLFSDLGIAPAIIQNRELDNKDLSNLFSFTVWMSLGISLLFFLLAGVIARYYGSPELYTICRVLALSLFFNTINIVPNALLYKEKAFKFLAKRSVVVQSLTGIVAVFAALNGAGIYALLINPVLSAFFIFIITFHRYPQSFHWTLGLHSLKKIFSYSLYQFLFNLINYFSRNLDKLLIGKYMGMNFLGYYEKSYRLMMLPLQNITHVITPVMHPIFSDYQDDIKFLESNYLKIVRLLAFIGFPLSVFLYFTAQELMLIIFGNQWEASVPVFRILALTVGLQMVLSTSGSIFQASGDTKSLFICGVFSAITNVSGMLIGIFVFKSMDAVAWSILITFAINFIQAYIQMYYVTFKLPVKTFMKIFISPMLLTLTVFLIFKLYSHFFLIENLFISLIIHSILFAIITGSYIQMTNEYDIIKKVKKMIK